MATEDSDVVHIQTTRCISTTANETGQDQCSQIQFEMCTSPVLESITEPVIAAFFDHNEDVVVDTHAGSIAVSTALLWEERLMR